MTFGTASLAPAEILIGMPGPLTGGVAWFGEQMQEGIGMKVAELNAAGGALGVEEVRYWLWAPVEVNEGRSAMRSRTGRFEAGAGTFGHEAWCGMLWPLTLSITTCSVWPSSQSLCSTARPVLRRAVSIHRRRFDGCK